MLFRKQKSHFNPPTPVKFLLYSKITKQCLLICLRQQQNQCILNLFRYFMNRNGKVIHVTQISDVNVA